MTQEELNTFETNLQAAVLKVCRSLGMTGDTLLESEDISGKWKEYAPEFMAEAVKNINSYPEFTLACAAYAGMAVAKWWDEDWGKHHGAAFGTLLGSRGFDNMDDHIMTDILGHPLESAEAGVITKAMECASQAAWDFIRHSAVEAGTADAFHALARACRVLFLIGETMELKSLGYRYTAIPVNTRYKN